MLHYLKIVFILLCSVNLISELKEEIYSGKDTLKRTHLLVATIFKNSPFNPHFLVDFSIMNRSETLPLIIKNYDFPKAKTFSSLVHKSPIGTEGFTIEGPFVIF